MSSGPALHIRVQPSSGSAEGSGGLSSTPIDDDTLDKIIEHLRSGGILAYPTGTVYGLGCLLLEEPLTKLVLMKSRPPGKPFLMLLPPGRLPAWLEESPLSRRLADQFWPGPLTVVLPPMDSDLTRHVVGPEGGVAVRRDAHPVLNALLARLDQPITSSSLNRPGSPPATSGDEAVSVLRDLSGGEQVWLLDAGPSPGTESSTIVDLTGKEPGVIRDGAISRERLAQVIPELGENPKLHSEAPFHILFVCTGNTCRSPMAETLAREMIQARGWPGVRVSSAGVFASPGAPASAGAQEAVTRAGMDLSGHRSRQVSPMLLDECDLVLTMTRSHLESLAMMDPLELPATTLAGFADPEGRLGHGDITDPIGGPAEVYNATLSELRTLVWEALDRLEEQVTP